MKKQGIVLLLCLSLTGCWLAGCKEERKEIIIEVRNPLTMEFESGKNNSITWRWTAPVEKYPLKYRFRCGREFIEIPGYHGGTDQEFYTSGNHPKILPTAIGVHELDWYIGVGNNFKKYHSTFLNLTIIITGILTLGDTSVVIEPYSEYRRNGGTLSNEDDNYYFYAPEAGRYRFETVDPFPQRKKTMYIAHESEYFYAACKEDSNDVGAEIFLEKGERCYISLAPGERNSYASLTSSEYVLRVTKIN